LKLPMNAASRSKAMALVCKAARDCLESSDLCVPKIRFG
jgi:hypothetical protein